MINHDESMDKFEPDYDKCKRSQKEVYWKICKHIKKDTYMYCKIDNKKCIAWDGYKHKD